MGINRSTWLVSKGLDMSNRAGWGWGWELEDDFVSKYISQIIYTKSFHNPASTTVAMISWKNNKNK